MSGPRRFVACLDVGGTSVKSALVGDDGTVRDGSRSLEPVDAAGDRETILGSFAGALGRLLERLDGERPALAGVGVSIGGPFDYERGISLITGLDKYEAIYGVDVKEELRQRLRLGADLPILFDIDAWAFARGEVWRGAARPYRRSIVFTMGTGVGSAFAADGRIVGEGPGVPWLGWISGQKHRDGILNDYLSRTFMIRRYEELTGSRVEVRDIALRAEGGDETARDVFAQVGRELGGFLRTHHVEEFGAECLVFGGQISKSFHLFAGPVREALRSLACLKAVVPAQDIDGSAVTGIARYVFERVATPGPRAPCPG